MNDLTRVSLVSLGLFAAFAVHDAEELMTMAPASRRALARAPKWAPIPEDLRTRGLSQAQVSVSAGIISVFVATASLAGNRRSAWFRGGLLAFGTHGFTHLASTAAAREYTTGVATSPAVVIPFWLWARRYVDTKSASTTRFNRDAGRGLSSGSSPSAVGEPPSSIFGSIRAWVVSFPTDTFQGPTSVRCP